MATLRSAYRPGVGMADAFARWLETLLGPYGLVVYDSSDPAAKPLVADLFARELSAAGRTATLAKAAGEALTARGHQPQVVPQPDSIALFQLDAGLDGARRPIRRQGDHFVAGEATFTVEALTEQARTSPNLFSPNVLLRPLVQDTLFPTICYVAGPSELAYLGQLREVYASFGIPMPLMYPRATATLVDSATARFLAKYNVPIEEFQPQDESALNRLLELAAAAIRRAGDQGGRRRDAPDDGAGGRGDAGRRSDARRRGADDAREDGTGSARAAEQDDSGGETPRRDAPAPVHAGAGADFSARPRAGTNARRRSTSSIATVRR